MHNAETVQVVKGSGKLMCDAACIIFFNTERALLQEGKEVAAGEILHHNVEVVLVLEDVIKSDDVGVLADLKHLNFPLQQLLVLQTQLLLLDYLDCHLLLSLLVDASLYYPIFALAQ